MEITEDWVFTFDIFALSYVYSILNLKHPAVGSSLQIHQLFILITMKVFKVIT